MPLPKIFQISPCHAKENIMKALKKPLLCFELLEISLENVDPDFLKC